MEMKTMSQPSWKNFLTPILLPGKSPSKAEFPRLAIVGIGNEFNGDDAAGVMVARKLGRRECASDAGHVIVIEAGQAPENITAEMRKFQPEVVILVDAAQLDAAPGTINWIPWESTTGMSASSHSLPLGMLARYLTLEFGCAVHLLGIQPAQNDYYSNASLEVLNAVDDICETFCHSFFTAQRQPD